MNARRAFATILLLSVAWCMTGTTPDAFASWVSENCRPYHVADSVFRRKDAQAYASVGDNEGYEWGGGCWDNDNVDDTPSAPDSSGEGPDCSGFTFKTWELVNASGASGGTWYDRLENVHGPYVAADFHSPVSTDPFFRVSKSRDVTTYMDALARDTHVAMLSSHAAPSTGSDYVWEALGDAWGSDLNVQSYRSNSAYTAARREGWTPDCYPNCARPTGLARVVRLP